MYESPIQVLIEKTHKQMIEQENNAILGAIQQGIGVDVDKEELLRALKYDRDQYEAGYRDGFNANRWISVEDRLPEENGTYLVHYHDDIIGEYVTTRQFYKTKFVPMEYFEEHTGRKAMHWMPLPTPPTEQE